MTYDPRVLDYETQAKEFLTVEVSDWVTKATYGNVCLNARYLKELVMFLSERGENT